MADPFMPSNILSNIWRAIDGCSLAALRTLVMQGPSAARKVIGAPMAVVAPKRGPHTMNGWDLVRAFPASERMTLHGGSWVDGCTSPLERFLMAQLIHHFKPAKIVEVGTYRGATTCMFLDNMSPDACIYTIDLPMLVSYADLQGASDPHLVEHRQIGADYLGHPLAGNVTQIFGDTFDPSTWAKIPDGIDFAFIDASHSYEAVRNDTEKLWPKLSPKAVVLWHDYTESVSPERGVGKYIRELMKTHPDVFICAGTDMAFRIPNPTLHEGAARLPAWYLSGDYYKRHPNGMLPWQTDFSSRQRQDRGGSP